MSQRLINHNEVLSSLQNEGYSIDIHDGYLVVSNVPYLDSNRTVKVGVLAMSLTVSGDVVLQPSDHTAYWVGEKPCNIDGSEVPSLINQAQEVNIGNGIITDYFLSCKPMANGGKYKDYYEKVSVYCKTISAPALNYDKEACECLKKPIIVKDIVGPLAYQDTNSSRANIVGINEKMLGKRVALIGVGGTGSYLLDHLSKTPVSEIHIYDDDFFETHNAFRCPGAASTTLLNEHFSKVDYLSMIYSNMHSGIVAHNTKITRENISELDGMDCVFICVDKVSVRNMIADYLISKKQTFIDSGLGVLNKNESLTGQVRVTTGVDGYYDHIKEAFGMSYVDDDDIYATNIQISELNNLAAIMMLMKWKRMIGVYVNLAQQDNHFVYQISTNNILYEKREN